MRFEHDQTERLLTIFSCCQMSLKPFPWHFQAAKNLCLRVRQQRDTLSCCQCAPILPHGWPTTGQKKRQNKTNLISFPLPL